MSNAPTLINLPPPPSDPVTPSDVPGTPNSTTTSMSELSTVAIKDGHRGHNPHHYGGPGSGPSGLSNQLDAEREMRSDRISRLAGLERVTTARNPQAPGSAGNLTPGAMANAQAGNATQNPTVSYFDSTGNPTINRERSTVGSASATGSVGARTTWAGSEAGGDFDKMSESQDMDMDTSSVGGMSEEGGGSLVAFGEGARTPARQSTISSPGVGGGPGGGGLKGMTPTHARMIDGMTYDQDANDTTASELRRPGVPSSSGQQEAERIMRENMDTTSDDRMRGLQGQTRQNDLGRFGFEK